MEKIWIHAFHIALMQSETQKASSRIWIRVADSISFNNNSYTKRVFKYYNRYQYLLNLDIFIYLKSLK